MERVDGGTSGESPNFDFPTPLKARRRPLNDLVTVSFKGNIYWQEILLRRFHLKQARFLLQSNTNFTKSII